MTRNPQASAFARWVKSLTGSLSLSLFLWLMAVILVAFAGFAVFSIRTASGQWSQSVNKGAERFSDLIKSSTHYGMLLNHKEDVHHVIQTVAQDPGVAGVRIYDKQGLIIFSARADEIGTRVDLQAEACVACHDQAEPLRSIPNGKRTRIYTAAGGDRVLGLISPIRNAPECSNASCHAHRPEQTILGVLDVKMLLAETDATLAASTRQVLTAGVLIALLAGLSSAGFIALLVRRPVNRLIAGTTRVAAGDLETVIPGGRNDEIGRLAEAFNRMTRDLGQAKRELTSWSDRLERRLEQKTEELGRSQRQVVHMEKMASLGKLAATVAHELNNPLAGILNYARLVERTLDESEEPPADEADLRRYLDVIRKESARCGAIVHNLLVFARRSGADMAPHSLRQIVERASMLLQHHMQIANVTFRIDVDLRDDVLVCDADQIQQALVALLVNAVEAMPNGGTLQITALAADGRIELTIGDSGQGIDPQILPHVFEPFFSTKDESQGVGLGLAVVYGIVQRHRGEITVESEPGCGTTFHVILPRRVEHPEPASPADARPKEEVQHASQHGT